MKPIPTTRPLHVRLSAKRLALTGGALAILALCATALAMAVTRSTSQSLPIASIRGSAFAVAQAYGDSAPTNGLIVESSRNRVAGLFDASVASDQKVYSVLLRGDFVANRPRPPGAPAPTGSYLTISLDADNFQPLDVVLTKGQPDIGTLGPATPLGP